MKYEWKGFGIIFRFTFTQHWKGKNLLRATVIVAVLCFLLPAVILPLIGALEERDATLPEDPSVSALEQVYVVDRTSTPEADLHLLNRLAGQGVFSNLTYRAFGDDAQAAVDATKEDNGKTLILCLDEQDNGDVTVRVLLPENSTLEREDVTAYQSFITYMFPYVLGAKLGLSAEQMMILQAPVEIAPHRGAMSPEEVDGEIPTDPEELLPQKMVQEILAMILPYFNIMLLYFMVLFYGQSVANNVILEKTSKLVDTLLVTVRPEAMILGKMLAIASSGALQLVSWLMALLGGFATGGALVRMISPNSQMGLLALMDNIDLWRGYFSLPGLILSIFILMSGFLLYCALSAIGGAMASKPEELSSTNVLFTMVLIVSFFCTLYAGGMGSGMSSSALWLNWVPFTAILVAPSRILLDELSLGGAAVSLLLILFATFLLVMLAGKIYRMLILYKGKVLKLGDVLKMIRHRSDT